MEDHEKEKYERALDNKHPQAKRWTRATSKYTCFGMAIANRWTHIGSWEAVDQVLRDEFDPIPEQEVVPGDLVGYRKNDGELMHLGVISRLESLNYREQRPSFNHVSIFVLSKWGAGAEYEHPLKHCPDGDCEIEFWRTKGKENNRRTP